MPHRDVRMRHDLEPVADRLRCRRGQRQHGLEHTADPITHQGAFIAALHVHVTGAHVDGPPNQMFAKLDHRGTAGRRGRAGVCFHPRTLRSQALGEHIELAKLRIAAVQRCDDTTALGYQHPGPPAGGERDIPFGVSIQWPAGGERQNPVVDADGDDEMPPRKSLGHEVDGQLACPDVL
jgi:hypothetical protein